MIPGSEHPLRVLHVIASMSPRHGGPTDAILRILPCLRELGVESMVASTRDDLETQLDVPEGKETDFLGVRGIFFQNMFRRPRRLRDFGCAPGLFRWLCLNIRRYDVVHVHALFSLVTWRCMAIAHAAGVPYVLRPLGVLGCWPLQHGGWYKRLFLNLLERRCLDRAAAIEFNSDSEREEAACLGLKAPVRVIPLGFEPVSDVPDAKAVFCRQHSLDPSLLLVLFFSRIDPKKGIERLLDACARLPAGRFHLVIAGAGQPDYERHIRSRLNKLGLAAKTVWAGFLQGAAKALALRAADVFVLPSYSESFGIAVAEAMSAGCAVITTPEVPLSSLVVEQKAGWVTHDLEVALAEALASPPQRTPASATRSLTYASVAPELADLYCAVSRS
jgi:glycosyltransferase involved in cell wall biosynthesis